MSALELEESLSPALKSLITVLIVVVKLLVNRVGLNSRNSSKPPSTDPNRPKDTESKDTKPKDSTNKPGGQKGHPGTTLEKVDNPDETLVLNIDRKTLP